MAHVSTQRNGDAQRVERVLAVLRRIAPDLPPPEIELTDETGSTARRASFGRPALIAMSRATVDLGGDALDGEVSHEFAHLIDPHGQRDWRLQFTGLLVLVPTGMAAWMYNAIHSMTQAPGSTLLVWAGGNAVCAAGLCLFSRTSQRTEFRADRMAAEQLGTTAPVLVMVNRVHARHVGRSRTQRLMSLMTHPHPSRRCSALEALV